MKKDQVDRQADQRPADSYAGGHDPKHPEPRDPNRSSKDKGKAPRRPDDLGRTRTDKMPAPEPGFDGKGMPDEGDRSDRASGRPVQLEGEEGRPPGRTETEPGRGNEPREARQGSGPTGKPVTR
jgi:hypothetical protein